MAQGSWSVFTPHTYQLLVKHFLAGQVQGESKFPGMSGSLCTQAEQVWQLQDSPQKHGNTGAGCWE